MPSWEAKPPRTYSIVTGFFPEVSPKQSWADDPRPLLVCGTAKDPETNIYFCRIAYGTSKISKAREDDLVIGNISILNQLGLKNPTRFVTYAGGQMVIMPWTAEFFRPWSGYSTPILGCLPDDVQRHVGFILASLDDLPQF